MKEKTIVNGVIESCKIVQSERYVKSLEMVMEIRLANNCHVSFSVWGPYIEDCTNNCFSYSLKRIMDICEVDEIDKIKGKAIRVVFDGKGTLGSICIGVAHFLNDIFFIPREEELYKNFLK